MSPVDHEPRLELGHDLQGLTATLHNGPGWRVAVWTQGCSLRCTDVCLSPHLLDHGGGRLYPVSAVAAAIGRVVATSSLRVEGITILGGEPSDQASAVAALARLLHQDGLSVMLYSGHGRDELSAELLANVDILVDGPFVPAAYDPTLPWRGSANQSLLLLTDRYRPEDLADAWQRQGKGFSIRSGRDGRWAVSGLQTRGAAARIAAMVAGAT